MSIDMNDARSLCAALRSDDPDIDRDYQRALAAEMLPAALDEIGRLRKEAAERETLQDRHNAIINGQAKHISALQEFIRVQSEQTAKRIADQDVEIVRLQKYCILTPDGKIFVPDGHPELERLRKENEEQAKRIAELEAFYPKAERQLDRISSQRDALEAKNRKQRAALKKLGAKVRELKREETELISEFEQRTPGRYRYLENKVRLLEPIHKADCVELLKMHDTIRKLGKKVRARGRALVEERAKRNEPFAFDEITEKHIRETIAHPDRSLRYAAAKGWARQLDELTKASQQLRQEGLL